MIPKFALLAVSLMILSPIYAYAVAGTATVELENTSFDINYNAEGLKLSGIEADLDFGSLLLQVEVSSTPATLEITLDRDYFDATESLLVGAADVEFFVLLDGFDEISYDESSNSQTRTLTFEIPAGTEEIEIIGTAFGDGTSKVMDKERAEELQQSYEEFIAEKKAESDVMGEEKVMEKVMETSSTQCGPGTVLKDGVCELDSQCGPGTILEDGVCVLSGSSSQQAPPTKELVFGAVGGFIVALFIMILLGIVAWGHGRRKVS